MWLPELTEELPDFECPAMNAEDLSAPPGSTEVTAGSPDPLQCVNIVPLSIKHGRILVYFGHSGDI